MFESNFNNLLNILSIKNCDIVKKTGISPSIISKYRNGKRKPYGESKEFNSIINAIYFLSKDKEKILLDFFNIKDNQLILEKINEYLNTDNLSIKKKKNNNKEKIYLNDFYKKLDSIMKLLNISNIELSNAIKLDTSLISRYRNNVRKICSNYSLIDDMISYFYKIGEEQNKLYSIHKLINNGKKFNSCKIIDNLNEWFKIETKEDDKIAIEDFLKSLNSYQKNKYKFNYNIEKKPVNFKNSYWGTNGIKEAIIDFGQYIINSDTPTNVSFYSNDGLNWIENDKDFQKKFLKMIISLISQNNKITIYQDINNSVENIINCVEKWLPIYFIDKIETKYITKTTNQKFSHTFVMAENIACLYSSGCINSKEDIEHYIITNKTSLMHYKNQFDILVKLSYPLIRTYTENTKEKYISIRHETANINGETLYLSYNPFFESMPIELLNKIINRYNLSPDIRKEILKNYEIRKINFLKNLQNNKITQYIYSSDKENKIDFSGLFLKNDYYYTNEEKQEHIKYLENLSKINRNYNICYVENQNDLRNIKIIVKNNYATFITNTNKDNKTIIIIEHQIINEAFIKYIRNLKEIKVK